MSVALKYFVSDVFHVFKNETDPVVLWLVHPWQWPMSRPLDILAQSGGWDFPRGRRGGSKDGLFSSLLLPPADSTREYSSVKIMNGNFWEVWKDVSCGGWEHWSPGKLERLGENKECRRRGKEGEQVALVLSALHHGAPFRLYTLKSESTPWQSKCWANFIIIIMLQSARPQHM